MDSAPTSLRPVTDNPAAFQQSARRFLSAKATPRAEGPRQWGQDSDSVRYFAGGTPDEERASVCAARAWQRTRYEHGWGWITGPARYGGLDLPTRYLHLYAGVEAEYDVPDTTQLSVVGLGMIGPTILEYGQEALRDRVLPAMYRGDVIACQLFSETEAGSDLAAVRTRAVESDGTWTIDGHKVWTSGAAVADIGVAVCRTDPDVPKHHGLTVFLIPMNSPGVTVRPIRQMTGGASFNEVYLEGVQLDDTHRLGPVGKGWQVALTVLAAERLDGGNLGLANADQAVELARNLGRQLSDLEKDRVADLVTRSYVQRISNMRVAGAVVAGEDPGPEASLGKLLATDTMARTSEVVRLLLSRDLTSDSGAWGTYAWSEHVLGAPGYRIAGGTDEIQHNIIAERVLGLPREPRP